MADWANFQLALAYCAERGAAEHGLRLCNAMAISWLLSGDQSGAAWLDRFLASTAPVPASLRARGLVVRAEIAFEQQDYDAAERFAAESAEVTRNLPRSEGGNLAGAQRILAVTATLAGRLAEALALADAAVATARSAGDAWDAGVTLAVKAGMLASLGDAASARLLYAPKRPKCSARAAAGLSRMSGTGSGALPPAAASMTRRPGISARHLPCTAR